MKKAFDFGKNATGTRISPDPGSVVWTIFYRSALLGDGPLISRFSAIYLKNGSYWLADTSVRHLDV
jgi:hypothetical protein